MTTIEMVDPDTGEIKTTITYETYVTDEQVLRVINEASETYPGAEAMVRRA